MVFDVASGVERHYQHSACNDAEADMVVALFWELKTFLDECVVRWQAKQGPKPEPVKVGKHKPRALSADMLMLLLLHSENQADVPIHVPAPT